MVEITTGALVHPRGRDQQRWGHVVYVHPVGPDRRAALGTDTLYCVVWSDGTTTIRAAQEIVPV